MSDSKQGVFWTIIGKVGVLLTVIWVIIQMFGYFSKPNEYKMEIAGNHFPYKTEQPYIDYIHEYNQIRSLDKAYTSYVDKRGTSISNLIKYEKSKEAAGNPAFKAEYDSYLRYSPPITVTEYNEVWTFKIENTGTKPIEDLIVEIPFSGLFQIEHQKGGKRNGKFENRIQIGNLEPGYSVNIYTWVDNQYSTPEYEEEKTRVTHKYGWDKIVYTAKADGIIAWNIKNNGTPFQIAIMVLILLFVVTFIVGVDAGPKIQKMDKERKLKELNELEKLKEEGALTLDSTNEKEKEKQK